MCLQVSHGRLTIKGERPQSPDGDGQPLHFEMRPLAQSFNRSFDLPHELPHEIDASKITANLVRAACLRPAHACCY